MAAVWLRSGDGQTPLVARPPVSWREDARSPRSSQGSSPPTRGPLTAQLHHKIDLLPDEPLLEMVLIGYAPKGYGPEVWTVEYRVEQTQVATRGEYWQTRVLRPRFTQLYPPEKKAPRMIVEARYPAEMKAPTLMALIQGNDPVVAQLRRSDVRFAKVLEAVDKGQAQKASPVDSAASAVSVPSVAAAASPPS